MRSHRTTRATPAVARPEPQAKVRKRERAIAEHEARLARIRKGRTIAMFLGLVPFAGSFGCDAGLALLCLPREIYLGVWAAIVGAVLGLSIRLVLERRRFQQESPSG